VPIEEASRILLIASSDDKECALCVRMPLLYPDLPRLIATDRISFAPRRIELLWSLGFGLSIA